MSSLLRIECDVCDFAHQFYTSPEISNYPDDKRRRGKKLWKSTSEPYMISQYYNRLFSVIKVMWFSQLCLNQWQKTAMTIHQISNRIKLASKTVAEKVCPMQLLNYDKTQNTNESFKGTIWNRVPEFNHVGLNTLWLGYMMLSAILIMKDKQLLDTISLLGIDPRLSRMSKACGSVKCTGNDIMFAALRRLRKSEERF